VDGQPASNPLRQYAPYIGFALAGLALLAVIAFGVKERYFTIAAESAVVDAPVIELRAPIAGRFVSALAAGEPVPQNGLLGTIRGIDGTFLSLESPCNCVVLEQVAYSGQHYQMGDPLVALIEADRPLLIRAQLPLDEVERLEIGDRAEIRFPGRDDAMYGQIDQINLRPRLEALRNPERDQPISRRLAQVLIRPDEPLQLNDFGSLVAVRFL
jgi:alginate biosynthesis protein Alg44